MKVFISVGQSQHKPLINKVKKQLDSDKYQFVTEAVNADIIISPADASSVFELLECVKPLVIVISSDVNDKNDLTVIDFVLRNNYCNVCDDVFKIEQSLESTITSDFRAFPQKSSESSSELFSSFNQAICENQEELYTRTDEVAVSGVPVKLFNSMADAVDAIIVKSGQVIPGSAIAINPEKIIKSRQDEFIKDILLSASIRYADGIGVVRTLTRKSGRKVNRIPGCELWEELMARAGKHQVPVFLIGAKPNVIEQAKQMLVQQYQVNICGIQDGFFSSNEENELLERLIELEPKIVSVALGSPRQEVLINRFRKACPETFFMGVGGTYDVDTNNVKRAPKIFRELNLEWFYRLASQPTRFGRQMNLLNYLFLDLFKRL